jgi:hypothetical protein
MINIIIINSRIFFARLYIIFTIRKDNCFLFTFSATMPDTKQRLFSLLNILSVRAARLLITFEHYMPSYLKPRRTSLSMTERNEFARALIEQEYQESYSLEEILHCRNIINSNDASKMEMGIIVNLKTMINRFKLLHPSHSYIDNLNVLSLLPYRTQCNCICRLSNNHSTMYII